MSFVESALGHKRSCIVILPECPLPGVKRPFGYDKFVQVQGRNHECLLFPKADVQIAKYRVKLGSANGHNQAFETIENPAEAGGSLETLVINCHSSFV